MYWTNNFHNKSANVILFHEHWVVENNKTLSNQCNFNNTCKSRWQEISWNNREQTNTESSKYRIYIEFIQQVAIELTVLDCSIEWTFWSSPRTACHFKLIIFVVQRFNDSIFNTRCLRFMSQQLVLILRGNKCVSLGRIFWRLPVKMSFRKFNRVLCIYFGVIPAYNAKFKIMRCVKT